MSSPSPSSSTSSSSSRRDRSVVGLSRNRVTFYARQGTGGRISMYREIQSHQWRSPAVRIMAYVTGAPRNATIVKKKTRVHPGTWEPVDGLADFHSRLFWITVYEEDDLMPADLADDIPRPQVHYGEYGTHEPAPAGGRVQQPATQNGLARDTSYTEGGFNEQPNGPAIQIIAPTPEANNIQPGIDRSPPAFDLLGAGLYRS
ncbi:hypothetical protein JDV02_004434 [Purpureocillium takamizusanense]|uniref:Uncharacterized protein n=1 Tax=Purpureocillium takamizusanense TaxID=2060973 RepID=A0A9Q8QFA2_9HYPO|nr:uncharacterized protein JDV02_004434 [Purpureocillium takamizusanense]UNI18146.1 hypothetical protein JDV02_004434 [Purpureocillium takamizusanense]